MRITKSQARLRRHRRVRQIVSGTAERPRICIYRSNRHVSAQVIDDEAGRTLVAATTVSKNGDGKNRCNTAQAKALGIELGKKMQAAGVTRAVFDRNSCIYHGVVRALAEGVRSVDEEHHFHF